MERQNAHRVTEPEDALIVKGITGRNVIPVMGLETVAIAMEERLVRRAMAILRHVPPVVVTDIVLLVLMPMASARHAQALVR